MFNRSLAVSTLTMLLLTCACQQRSSVGPTPLGLQAPATLSQNAAEQIVFSGQTPPGTFSVPAGFWVWCEDEEAGNPYEGRCAGSMYFYALELVRAVFGTVTELASGAYRMTLSSQDGSISCTLENVPPVTKGPSNNVNVDCSSPAVSDTFGGAVVRVTGP